MVRSTPRFALLLCVLILLQECAHVHMAKTFDENKNDAKSNQTKKQHRRKDNHRDKSSHEKDKKQRNPNEDEYQWLDDGPLRLQPQKQLHQTSSRRGWISRIFKAVKFGGKVASAGASLAGLGNSIFRAIAGCCGDFPDACKYRDEFLKLKTQIAEKSKRADEIQLEAANIQVYTNYSINAFEDIIDQLNEIENEQEAFLRSISPEVLIVLNKETSRIEKFIKEKNETGQEVDFLEISSMYETALESALSIGLSLLSLIPVGKDIYDFAVKKTAASATAKVEQDTSVNLKNPKRSSSKSKQGKLGRWISKGVRHYKTQVANIKQKLNVRFGKAVKIASGVFKGFKVASHLLGVGFDIYNIIASRESCKARQQEAKNASDHLLEVSKFFDKTEAKLTEAKAIMATSFEYLRGNITDDSTIGVIENIKKMVEDISGPSEDLVNVAVELQQFLDNIKQDKTLEGTYRLEESLVNALRKIPFTVKCYTNKVKFVKYVTDDCKKGKASFDTLYDEARELFDFGDSASPDSPESCARKTGFSYIDKADLLRVLKEIAKKENFKETCELNDPTKRETACTHLGDGYDAKEIADKMKITEAQATLLTQDCPKVSELNPKQKEQVCNLRGNFNIDNENIANSLVLDLKLVEAVNC